MDMGLGLVGVVGVVAVFGFFAFVAWLDYRKKKDERDAAHLERMKALELGYPPQDAEIERARAYASAARAAGLIGLVVPVAVVMLSVIGTIVAVVRHLPGEDLATPLSIAWTITAIIVLVAMWRSLSVIRQLPRPTAESQPRAERRQAGGDPASGEFQEKRMEL
jgi:heme/copper-type cytochrome/quinol oxidase subunit 2